MMYGILGVCERVRERERVSVPVMSVNLARCMMHDARCMMHDAGCKMQDVYVRDVCVRGTCDALMCVSEELGTHMSVLYMMCDLGSAEKVLDYNLLMTIICSDYNLFMYMRGELKMKTVTILKTKDGCRAYKFVPMDEPIVYDGTTYGYVESLIVDGIVVCQRMIERCEINYEIDLACADISDYDRVYSGLYKDGEYDV